MLIDRSEGAAVAPLLPLSPDAFRRWSADAPADRRGWASAYEFAGKPGQVAILGAAEGVAAVLVGTGETPDLWTFAGLPRGLPAGTYALDPDVPPDLATRVALGWAIGGWRFGRYKPADGPRARLLWPETVDRPAIERAAAATALARELVTTPANEMGPAELAAAAAALAEAHGASCTIIEGEALLEAGYPMVHAVGRASTRAPRLVDLRWGDPDAPRVTLVGKGVCFDSGGLDIKPSGAMLTMKKDMGGAAQALGVAQMVMQAGLRVRLRVLIPAVENAISGSAFRPLDVLRSRKGLTVEIGNTDAEGRLVLADALDAASAETPALLVDFATLTGAARVALGADLPAMFCNDDALAAELEAAGREVCDPVWRLPLWRPYARHLDSAVADLSSTSDGPFAGAITAALFLERFVAPGIPWIHLDLFAWNAADRPGRPKGGEAMALRAVAALIEARFGG